MTKVLTHRGRKVAHRLLVIQALLAIISALGFFVIDYKAGYSAFIGGMICVMPNLVFVIYAYRFGGARAARKIASSFYRGETIKIMLTALMFAVTFIFIPVAIGPLMTTYVLCLLVFWFAPLFS